MELKGDPITNCSDPDLIKIAVWGSRIRKTQEADVVQTVVGCWVQGFWCP